ncbi:PSD1 and planctomycete cytochrome C domain-containing protein [Rosistilla oblonga]|uniref:PSD1 and planctomycete cytochrome C domain-containing protein n=1 Tax=Rosistilla oblonga TaxID=2527990 RepID=UPI003A983D4C
MNFRSHCSKSLRTTLHCLRWATICGAILLVATEARAAESPPISFNRDIRPILSDRCFACHGPDAETVAGGLRLDVREQAVEAAIVPGDAAASEVIARVLSDDDDLRMPPAALHKPLDESQIVLLKRWIDEGAEYEVHWAYTPLRRPELPPHQDNGWGINAIDSWIAARLAEVGVEPSRTADPVTLVRRLVLDLTGMPPTPAQAEQFVSNPSNEAYEQLIDQLLDSPRFGERMAIYWLDLVRYADTVGYHGDQDVSMSPYRDYVINAFNRNLPYDQFVREQLAGDLLPNPTLDQIVASGYNRLNQTTEEGGAQPKEYLAIYFADRVRNVSQVFMGATVGCAQCHDHKYDPYTAKDFYALGAFFADLEEQGKYGARQRPPQIPVPTAEESQQLAALDQQVDRAQQDLTEVESSLLAGQAEWEAEALKTAEEPNEVVEIWLDDQPLEATLSGDWNAVTGTTGPVQSGEVAWKQVADKLTQHYFINAKQTITIQAKTRLFGWVYLDPETPPVAIMLQWNDGDWNHRAVWGSDAISYGRNNPKQISPAYRRQGKLPETGKWIRLEVDAADVGFKPGDVVNGMAFTQFDGTAYWDSAGTRITDALDANLVAALRTPAEERSDEQTKQLREHNLATHPAHIEQSAKVDRATAARDAFAKTITTTPISKSVTPRPIKILHRGNWMDESGEVVEPAIPEFLGALETEGRATRLDLANWMCEPENVSTARTMVNRLWYLMFGRGICSSVDDFGGQGTFPSHPELLDYLAVEFVESGWDIKQMLRMIARSATYRQSSKPSAALRAQDPYNDLFARQGRFRISAEMVRDTNLMISGLLVEKVGGPSSKPYQPAGYYAQLNFPRRTYVADDGPDQYRRGVYTHWQRTFLHPMLKAFDAPSREECTAMRSRSNTPLQALTLLNDPSFVEAARAFAVRIMREPEGSVADRIDWAYRQTVLRDADPFVRQELEKLYASHHEHFAGNLDQAQQMVGHGKAPVPDTLDTAELAAWISVARVLLNLNETITRY